MFLFLTMSGSFTTKNRQLNSIHPLAIKKMVPIVRQMLLVSTKYPKPDCINQMIKTKFIIIIIVIIRLRKQFSIFTEVKFIIQNNRDFHRQAFNQVDIWEEGSPSLRSCSTSKPIHFRLSPKIPPAAFHSLPRCNFQCMKYSPRKLETIKLTFANRFF